MYDYKYRNGANARPIRVSCQLPIIAMMSPEIRVARFIKLTLMIPDVSVLIDLQSTASLDERVPALFSGRSWKNYGMRINFRIVSFRSLNVSLSPTFV